MKKMLYIDATGRTGESWFVETDGTVENMAKIVKDFGVKLFQQQAFVEDVLFEIDDITLYTVTNEETIDHHYYGDKEFSPLVRELIKIHTAEEEKKVAEQEEQEREIELQTLKRLKEKYPDEV